MKCPRQWHLFQRERSMAHLGSCCHRLPQPILPGRAGPNMAAAFGRAICICHLQFCIPSSLIGLLLPLYLATHACLIKPYMHAVSQTKISKNLPFLSNILLFWLLSVRGSLPVHTRFSLPLSSPLICDRLRLILIDTFALLPRPMLTPTAHRYTSLPPPSTTQLKSSRRTSSIILLPLCNCHHHLPPAAGDSPVASPYRHHTCHHHQSGHFTTTPLDLSAIYGNLEIRSSNLEVLYSNNDELLYL